MTTLHKRATPQQAYILRAVSGAVRNVAHAHPGWITDQRAAGSIAKRATGTLSAQWPAVLAASGPSNKAARSMKNRASERSAQIATPSVGASPAKASKAAGHSNHGQPPDAVKAAFMALGVLAAEARRRGDVAYLAGLEDALRIIGHLRPHA